MSANDALSRTKRDLDKRKRREADVAYRYYVGPYGDKGLHRVKRLSDGMTYVVAGPRDTFRPGTVVPTGSNVGNQGETILIEPPPGHRGNPTFPGVPNVIQPPTTYTVNANGEFGVTTVVNPVEHGSVEVSGGPFTISSWMEIFDGEDDFDGSPLPMEGRATILSQSFVSSAELNFDLRTLGAGFSFKVRVWNAHPDQGGSVWREHPDDPDPANYFDSRYQVNGL